MRMFNRILLATFLAGVSLETVAAAAPWADGFTPPPGKYSWVQLDSGEWLKGELIALYDDTLVFDSDHFGNLHLDGDDIESVYGKGVFIISLGDGRAVSGTLNIRGQTVSVAADDGDLEFPRANLVSITQTAERERDRWSGNVDFGLNVREGNTDISDLNVAAGFTRRTPVSRVSLDYRGNSNVTEGVRQTDSHRANLSVDRFTGRRFFWRPVSAQYYKDELQNINHQGTVDTGFGFQVIDTPRTSWEIQAGVGGNYRENVSVAPGEEQSAWSPVGTLSTNVSVDVTSWIEWEFLWNMVFLEESAGRFQHHMVNTLSTDLIGDLDLDVSLVWDRTKVPQEAEDGTVPQQDDYQLMVSLSYEF
jgi:putative salt-induced outer membrane protein YdiY